MPAAAEDKHPRAELGCVTCDRRYSWKDIRKGCYFATFVCRECYRRMVSLPYYLSCFGKPTVVIPHLGQRLPGYDEAAIECKSLCPDREICRGVLEGTISVESRPEKRNRMRGRLLWSQTESEVLEI